MGADVDLVREIVRSHLPAFAAASIRPLGAGEDHVAYEVDGALVVRLARDGGTAAAAARIEREDALLETVAAIAPVAVPRPLFADAERGCSGYAKLGGVPLLGVAPAVRARHAAAVAAVLGELLHALHATPVADVAALVETDLQPAAEELPRLRTCMPRSPRTSRRRTTARSARSSGARLPRATIRPSSRTTTSASSTRSSTPGRAASPA